MGEEIIIKATKNQIEEFKSSMIWIDFIEELNSWKEGFKREMDSIVDDAGSNNPSTASVLLHMGDLNGRIKAVNYMLSLPDIFLQILEDKKDDSSSK